jgi:hypothetical protein
LLQVLCFTRSELKQQLLSISFHHQDMPVFEHFFINIRHGRFGFSDEFKQELIVVTLAGSSRLTEMK